MLADEARGVAVGADPKRVRVLDVQQVRELVEQIGDFDVVDWQELYFSMNFVSVALTVSAT
jgi:hypothetical protein